MSDTRKFFSDLNELTYEDSAKIATIITLAGDDWADADAIASSQEEQKKNYLAKLIAEYLDMGLSPANPGDKPKTMPISQAEMRAQGDPRYDEYLRNMVAARRKAISARVRYDMAKLYVEMQRSAWATKRQELQSLHMHR